MELSWTRRSRGGWTWQDGADLPLNEQSEAYAVTYGTSTAVLASWEVPNSALSLTAGELTALTALAPNGTFAIRQRGDRAVSAPLNIILT